uniref:Coiled-coil domain-containing protein 43 n=1 Tax=Ornithorhynchus anatinus TaxID=9258 RepID=F6TSR6_ORNAN
MRSALSGWGGRARSPLSIMATAPGGFGPWLDGRLEALGVDRAVYGSYIRGLLQEDEDEEKLDALQGILAAFLEEESLLAVCQEIIARWAEAQTVPRRLSLSPFPDEVLAIASLMEKQAQIVVKPRAVSEEEKQRKAALLAQYANVTDDEEYPGGKGAATLGSDKSLFRNTNVEAVLAARKLERDGLRDEAQRKKEQDRLQREKDRLAKQERKDKEKKRTQKGERKR